MDPVGIVLVFTYVAVLNGEGWFGGELSFLEPVFPRRTISAGMLCLLPPLVLYGLLVAHGHPMMGTVPLVLFLGLLVIQGIGALLPTSVNPASPGFVLGFHGVHLFLFWIVSSLFVLPDLSGISSRARDTLLVLIGGGILAVPTARFVYVVMTSYSKEIGDETELTGAGQTIGQLERLMIYVLYLTGHVGVIGFLIAAKSILRFGEMSHESLPVRKHTEYVIIGTLWSFLLALVVSWAIDSLL